MTAKAIVQIDVDDSKFREFNDLFLKYQKRLGEMPDDWKKVVDVIGEGGAEMGDFAKSSKLSKEFLMIAAIQANAISQGMARATGVQDKFNTKVKDGAIQMGRMAKFSKEMHKDISKMSSIYLKLGALGAAAMAMPMAVFGATNKLAGQNLQARGLGLKIGQTQAFDANFEKLGLGTSDLSNVANAQSDVSKWRAFTAAGLTPEQIQNEDAEQLTVDFARKASEKYRGWQKNGMPAASMAQAYGFTDILSLQQLRTGASYSDADWQRAQAKEIADAKKNAIDQGTADTASDVKASLKSNWAEVMNTFNSELGKAAPELKILGDAAAGLAITFVKMIGPQAKEILHALEGNPISREDAAKSDTVAGALARMGYDIRDLASGVANTHMLPQPTHDVGGKITMPGSAAPSGSMKSMLLSQYQIESGRGKHLLSPKGARGPMQFMPDTWKQWGHGDVNNLQDSMNTAAKYDAFLLKRYGGDNRKELAAYNWGMGNLDKDISKHGDKWEQFAPKETQNYISKIMSLMAKQGSGVNINITNSTTANVATSMNAAPH